MDANTNLSAYYYWGAMDDFMFWNRELSNAEIESLCKGNTPTFINELSAPTELSIYYSATSIDFSFSDYGKLTIYNTQGQVVLSKENLSPISLNKNTLNSGLYTAEVNTKKDVLRGVFFIE